MLVVNFFILLFLFNGWLYVYGVYSMRQRVPTIVALRLRMTRMQGVVQYPRSEQKVILDSIICIAAGPANQWINMHLIIQLQFSVLISPCQGAQKYSICTSYYRRHSCVNGKVLAIKSDMLATFHATEQTLFLLNSPHDEFYSDCVITQCNTYLFFLRGTVNCNLYAVYPAILLIFFFVGPILSTTLISLKTLLSVS